MPRWRNWRLKYEGVQHRALKLYLGDCLQLAGLQSYSKEKYRSYEFKDPWSWLPYSHHQWLTYTVSVANDQCNPLITDTVSFSSFCRYRENYDICWTVALHGAIFNPWHKLRNLGLFFWVKTCCGLPEVYSNNLYHLLRKSCLVDKLP